MKGDKYMGKNNLYKRSIILWIIFLSLLISSFSNIGFPLEIDEDDGWWNDTFQDDGTVTLTHCEISDGSIILNSNESSKHIYKFTNKSESKAYSCKIPLFTPLLPPSLYILLLEKEFTTIGYSKIKSKNNDTTSSETSLLQEIHHFRFKLNQSRDSVTQLDISWCGKAENDQKITMYYWQPIGNSGIWNNARTAISKGNIVDLQRNFTGEVFISNDSYVDICIVVTPEWGKRCSLSSDYVEIVAYSYGYALAGTAISTLINPINIYSWELFTWDDREKSGTSIKHHILYENGTLIDDTILPGNKDGYDSSNKPVSLVSIDVAKIDKIKIRANLTTSNPSVSPKLHSWNVLWQTEEDTWEDMFNSKLRIDVKDSIKISNGNASILPFYNDWTIFGQNPSNTRASDGYGPDSNDIYWYSPSNNQTGGNHRNPVINDGKLFVASQYGDEIYVFNTTVSVGSEGGPNPAFTQGNVPQYLIENSPAISDNLIILATGSTSKGGEENKVYALDNNNLEVAWEFNYSSINPSNPNICYSASPTISNDKIFLSSWSGDESLLGFLTAGNNKIIALDLDGNWQWDSNLPAGSFSCPTVYGNTVIVGCENANGESLYAFDIDSGENVWNSSVGSVGRASPVVYDNTVFAVVKKEVVPLVSARTEVIALSLDDGSIIWNVSISNPMLTIYDLAVCSPAVYNGVIFVASPDGTLYALDVKDGTEKWTKPIYTKGIASSQVLVSSPSYADGMIYIGTPDGTVKALDAATGDVEWTHITEHNSAVLSSPIVVDGLLYVSDEDGTLYSLGSHKEPEDQEITGRLISIPIRKPHGYSWNKFYANYTTTNASIKFRILNKDETLIRSNIKNGDNISKYTDNYNVIKLRADFTADTSSDEAILYNWSVTTYQGITDEEYPDTEKPIFYEDSFRPENGWIATNTPTCTIDVKDVGTEDNITGLNISSAKYTLKYKIKNQSGTKTNTSAAQCSGNVGSTNKETISADISELDFSENITELISIRFYIEDLAKPPNSNEFFFYEFEKDTEKPYSYIDNTGDIPYKINITPVEITATAVDNVSDIDHVTLYYRVSADSNWTFFSSDDISPYIWSFSIASGEYELCTIATDYADNEEDYPTEGDVSFIFDPNPPDAPLFDDEYRFDELPEFSIEFKDDYKLKSVEYRLDFHEINKWTKINDDEINSKNYIGTWNLTKDDWDSLIEEESYYIYFRLTDSLENQYITPSANKAVKIIKDFDIEDTTPYDPDLSDFDEWHWDNKFAITVNVADDTNVTRLQLYYSYSPDNKTWTVWKQYGNNLTNSPFIWNFTAKNGSGYYKFKTIGWDARGKMTESQVEFIGVTLFPMISIIMIPLAVILILVTAFVLGFKPFKLKKKKT